MCAIAVEVEEISLYTVVNAMTALLDEVDEDMAGRRNRNETKTQVTLCWRISGVIKTLQCFKYRKLDKRQCFYEIFAFLESLFLHI